MPVYGTLGEQLTALQGGSSGVVLATDHGLINDSGISDQTSSLRSAIAVVPPGGSLILPPWLVKFSSLFITTPINIFGAGAFNVLQAFFADPSWDIARYRSFFGGTVLYSTVTSSPALTWESTADINGGSLQGLMILGPGSGSSSGLAVGGSHYVTGFYTRNCIVANFSAGVSFSHVEDSHCDFTIMGCSTGLTTESTSTNNILRLNIQFSTVIGLDHGGRGSRILTSLFQDNMGIIATISGNGNTIDTPWIENASASSGVTISGGQTLLLNPSFHTPADTLTISGNNNIYVASGNDISTTISGSRNTIIGELSNPFTITPNQSNTVLLTNQIILPNLPSSDPSVAGQLWSNSGIVTVSSG